MRPANLTLKAASLAVLTLCAAAASAITPAPPEAAMSPIGAASAAAPAKSLTSAAVQAVSMGNPTVVGGQSKKAAVGTIAELEELQRQTALAEARKRLQELSQGAQDARPAVEPATSSATPPQSYNAMPGSQLPRAMKSKPKKTHNAARGASTSAAASTNVVLIDPIINQPPTAKLVNLLVMGGRARADVLDDGRMLTIKEGDSLSNWTVASITADGVTVEYRYEAEVQAEPAVPPKNEEMRPAIAEAFPAAYALANSQRSSVKQDRVKTVKLKSATPQEIAAATGATVSFGGPLPPTIPNAAPLQAMAGGNGSADSTSIPPVPPLPAPLGGSNATPLDQR